MKICILTGKFGMGHISAAQAIKQQITDFKTSADVEIIDWFQYSLPGISSKYYKFFELFVDKGRMVYNVRYRLQENRKPSRKPELYHYFKWRLLKLLEEKKPDVIVSTLPICSQIVSMYKEETGSVIPLITCVTDITGHSEWINKNTDYYMIGSQSVKEKFILKGVSEEKLFDTGIPVRSEFKGKADRKLFQAANKKKLLIMGGGLGLLPENEEFYKELERYPEMEVSIITGRNQKLYNLISGKYKNIQVLGYINNVHDYMKQADALLTKPGGVTVFEAIHAGVPILALNPFLQQEIYNAHYIKETQIGTVINCSSEPNPKEIMDVMEESQLDYYRLNIQRVRSKLLDDGLFHIMDLVTKNSRSSRTVQDAYFHVREEGDVHETISFNI